MVFYKNTHTTLYFYLHLSAMYGEEVIKIAVECPAMFLHLPGAGQVHLIDFRGLRKDVVRNGPLCMSLMTYASQNDFAGFISTYGELDFGEVIIAGPLGWTLNGRPIPGTEPVMRRAMNAAAKSQVTILEPHSAFMIHLFDDPLGHMWRCYVQTPSLIYSMGSVSTKKACTV